MGYSAQARFYSSQDNRFGIFKIFSYQIRIDYSCPIRSLGIFSSGSKIIFPPSLLQGSIISYHRIYRTGCTPYQKIRELYEKKTLPVLPTQVINDLPKEMDELIKCMCAFEASKRLRIADLIELINILI